MSSDRAVRRFGTRTGNRTHGIFLILLYTWEPPRPAQTIRQELAREIILGQDLPPDDDQR